MDTTTILTIIEVVVAILLMAAVLVQNKGAGLSSTFGGATSQAKTVKRGPEKFIFNATIVLAVIFVGLSIAQLFVQ